MRAVISDAGRPARGTAVVRFMYAHLGSDEGRVGMDERAEASEDGITIASAAAGDVPLLRRLIFELADYEHLSAECEADEALLAEWLFGPRAVAEALVARFRGEPAGMALFFRSFSTFKTLPGLYLEDLFVRPHLRGRGVGRALMVHLARLARERGYARFEWSVLDWNEPALRFYRALGAVPLEDWTMWRLTGDALREV
jgi:GNAT superfamily N-acetyltransferase